MTAAPASLARLLPLTCAVLTVQAAVGRRHASGEETPRPANQPQALIGQLRGPMQDSLVESMREWTSWPSDAYIKKHRARRDRSKEIPPVYPPGLGPGWKPSRPGAMPPTAAVGRSIPWVVRVLREKWLPEEENPWRRPRLAGHMIPLQLDPASKSTVICQYQVEGHRWHVAQTVSGLCLVIKPEPGTIAGVPPEDLGPLVFRTFLANADKITKDRTRPFPVQPQSLTAYVPEHVSNSPLVSHSDWFKWQMWYTDGRCGTQMAVR